MFEQRIKRRPLPRYFVQTTIKTENPKRTQTIVERIPVRFPRIPLEVQGVHHVQLHLIVQRPNCRSLVDRDKRPLLFRG